MSKFSSIHLHEPHHASLRPAGRVEEERSSLMLTANSLAVDPIVFHQGLPSPNPLATNFDMPN